VSRLNSSHQKKAGLSDYNEPVAEGVVFEPFLPTGDQGRKGGFATLSKPAFIGRYAIRIPAAVNAHP